MTRAEVDAMYESVRYVAVAHLQPLPNGDLELQRRLTGRTPAGRYLTVACQIVTAPDGREVFRPVTAWNAEAHEVETFRLDFPDD